MTTVEVFVEQSQGAMLVGQAHFTRQRGQVSTTFLYDPGYLAGGGMSIDPALPLVAGAQHQSGLVRAFADSAPDRWGRNLIKNAERDRARSERRSPRHLDDLDILLAVSDDTRQGALRYRCAGSTSFTGGPAHVPHLISLPDLLRASDELLTDEDPAAASRLLLDTGTAGLGGARPKVSVRLEDGALAIAKFPHRSDQWDVIAWEATALDVLDAAGIRTPRRRLTRVGKRSVLLLRRFDRAEDGRRIGYLSAMTALGASDGDQRDYSDIAGAMRDLSFSPEKDHHELFDRVVTNVVLGNTDDHLRNHGFLADRGFWTLSPVFDVNPNPDTRRKRATTILGADVLHDEAEALLPLAEECSLTVGQARERMRAVIEAFANWKECARSNGIQEREIAMMAESVKARLGAVATAANNM